MRLERGVTLIEILVVITIMGIVFSIILWPFASFRNEKLLDGAAEDIMSLLNEARNRTISSDDASVYGVYFESGKITLFKGAAFPGAGNVNNKEISLSSRLTISTITLTGGGSSVIFKRLTGTTTQTGSVALVLVTDSTHQRVITISSAGGISLN